MEEFFKAIEDKIRAAGYQGPLDGEALYDEICDEIWYIYVEEAVRENRLYYSRGYDAARIKSIMRAQLPKEMFLEHSDRVIDNSGVFAETMLQLDKIIKEL